MKFSKFITLLIALAITASRILHTRQHMQKHKKHAKVHFSARARKLSHASQLSMMSTQLSTEVDTISHVLSIGANSHVDKSRDVAHVQREVDIALKDANNLITRYVNEYVLTPRVVRGYDKYLQSHAGARKAHDQNGVLVYLAKHVKDIKLRKKEDLFFAAVTKYGDIIRSLLHSAKSDNIKLRLIKRGKVKLVNANKLVAFVRKYMFFVTHLNTDYHFVDRDFAHYGEKEIDVADKHIIKHKNFSRSNEHVPMTIVINKEELMGLSDQKSNTSIEHALSGSPLAKSILDNDSLRYEDNSNDADEVKLLVHEKQAAGILVNADDKLNFIEPEAKHDELLVDADYSKKVNEVIGMMKEEETRPSELNNLGYNALNKADNNISNFSLPSKSIYEQGNISDAAINGGGEYLHKLLNINKEPVELNVQSQANAAEGSTLELIRQPHIESVHDHGYITVINSDDNRNIRLSGLSDFNSTQLGNESKQVVTAYNRMAEMNSQEVGDYLQAQSKQTQSYFQPIVNQTLNSMNQPIILPKSNNNAYAPYYADGHPIEFKKMPSTVRVVDNKPLSGRPQARRLLGSGGYWGRKADSAIMNLLSGKF